MLTNDGADLLANAVAAWLADARLTVSDGSNSATASLDGPPEVDGSVVRLTATFTEQEANFTWSESRVQLGATVVDVERKDQGRKAPGAIWTHQHEINVGPS